MPSGDIAVVSYLENSLGEYLAALTKNLAPLTPLRRPHITLFPHRPLPFEDDELVSRLHRIAPALHPVPLELDQVATFLPVTPVVYLRVQNGINGLLHIHEQLIDSYNARELPERFAYQPHLTLAYDLPESEVEPLQRAFRDGWSCYSGSRTFVVEQLTVVRESSYRQWKDLGGARLGM
jgi:2'-5' RNA ligase